MNSLNASSLASLPEALRNELIDSLPREKALQLKHDWWYRARDAQKPPPGDWRVWLVLAGRGFGKTRTGGELVRARVGAHTARRIALVALPDGQHERLGLGTDADVQAPNQIIVVIMLPLGERQGPQPEIVQY